MAIVERDRLLAENIGVSCHASGPTSISICAVVVAFYPDPGFEERLRNVLAQVGGLVVLDNTPYAGRKSRIEAPTETGKQVCLIENHDNLGVGAALNRGLDQALRWGFEWILTLDQDSRCHADMVQTLVRTYAASDNKTAVIGANYFDPQVNRSKVPTNSNGEFLEQKTVITSGSLVDGVFARAIGGFRADYFIDQLDHEFCLRVRARGARVIISRETVMLHSVGESGGAWVPFLGNLPNHPPIRKYYIARNSVVTVSEYWRREPAWCLGRIARLLLGALSMLLLEKNGLAKIRAFALGVTDGVCGRMGPCQRKLHHSC